MLEARYPDSEDFRDFFTKYWPAFISGDFKNKNYQLTEEEEERLVHIFQNVITKNEPKKSLLTKLYNLKTIANIFAKQKIERMNQNKE